MLPACGEPVDAPEMRIGGPGRSPGRFATPRGVDVRGGVVYVVDRSGRLQAFEPSGAFLREVEVAPGRVGFPIGVAVDPATGGVWLVDTHQARLRLFDRDLNEQERFGELGPEPGRFTYPQRAVVAPDGLVYVAEYGEGESNRVQVFDRDGTFVRAFGGYGFEGGLFTRPMGIVVIEDRVYVTDVSDRIVVYRTDGTFVREFGRSGGEPGELRYPYGIAHGEGLLYVAEYGNHRVSRFDLEGRPLGQYGRLGSGPGELRGPWDVAYDDGSIYVADTGNDRIVVIDPARVDWEG